VGFSNRDKQKELFNKRHMISNCKSTTGGIPENLAIKENLTKYRKLMFNEASQIKQLLDYKFLWTWQGQIFMHQHDNSKAFKIFNLYDLDRLKKFSLR